MVRSPNSTATLNSSVLIAVAATVAVLYFGRQIFIPLALAVVLGFLLTPAVSALERLRLKRVPAVMGVLALGFALAVLIGWVLGSQLLDMTAHIGDYKTNLVEKVRSLRAPKDGTLSKASDSIRELHDELTTPSQDSAPPGHAAKRPGLPGQSARPIPVQVTAPPSNLVEDLRTLLGPLTTPLETAGMVIIFTSFTLIRREDLRNRLIRLGGRGQLNVMTQALDDASHRLSRYLLLQFLVNAAYGTLFGLGLFVFGIPHALLWGALAALLRLVPYVGALAATVPPVAFAVAVFPGWRHALLIFALYVVLEIVIANIVEPWLYGAHTGVSSLAILVAAIFWTSLWGPVGLILSTPLTVCLMLAGRYVPQLEFLVVLLGDEPVLRPEEVIYQRFLAMDQDEPRNIAKAYLQRHTLCDFYETVLIPALRMSEEDRHKGVLDEQTSALVYKSARELIEDLEDARGLQPREAPPLPDSFGLANVLPLDLICVPSRDEADELIGMMFTQLLRQAGHRAAYLTIGTVEDMLAQVSRGGFRVACLSALPPFAIGQARSLCKRVHARFPDMGIILGLWDFAGGVSAAEERLGPACEDPVATTLTEALLHVSRFSQTSSVGQIERTA